MVATGGNTELGHINQMMAGIEKHRTPLLVQMDKLGKAIFILILVMMAALFVFSLLFRDMPVSELMLSLISLAVASVPEGLPAIISIILSLGVQAMARQKAIIRKLPTVETLGAMTVICSDKTGTLTMNEMTVKAVITADSVYRVEGDSYEPVGKIHAIDDPTPVTIAPGSLFERYLRTIDLCNDSQLIKEESGLWKITGGPTEGALKVLAAKVTLPPLTSELRSKIPFDSQYKYMSTLYRLGEEEVVLVTGAPDVLFRLCQYQQSDSGLQPLDLPYWEGKIEEYAREGATDGGRSLEAGCRRLDRTDPSGSAARGDFARGRRDDGSAASGGHHGDCRLPAGRDPREDDHRRPPANGDEHRQDAGDWQCGKCHYRTRAGGDGRRAAERSRAAV